MIINILIIIIQRVIVLSVDVLVKKNVKMIHFDTLFLLVKIPILYSRMSLISRIILEFTPWDL